jgi:hypothetical protein
MPKMWICPKRKDVLVIQITAIQVRCDGPDCYDSLELDIYEDDVKSVEGYRVIYDSITDEENGWF